MQVTNVWESLGRFLGAASLALTFGCVHGVAVSVRDGETGRAVAGVRVERYRAAYFVEKVINPVGRAYHPLVCAGTRVTDQGGHAVFRVSSLGDIYRVYVDAPLCLEIGLWEQLIRIPAPPTQDPDARWEPASDAPWIYSVWRQDGILTGRADREMYVRGR
jgi:hypothetical protein